MIVLSWDGLESDSPEIISGGYLHDGFIRGKANESTRKAAAVPSAAKRSSR